MRVVVATGRYGGQRFGWLPDPEVFRPTARTPEPSPSTEPPRPAGVSARAFALGLRTLADVARVRRESKQGWSVGKDYHCSICNRDLSASGARKHEKATGHDVLRMDFAGDTAP